MNQSEGHSFAHIVILVFAKDGSLNNIQDASLNLFNALLVQSVEDSIKDQNYTLSALIVLRNSLERSKDFLCQLDIKVLGLEFDDQDLKHATEVVDECFHI